MTDHNNLCIHCIYRFIDILKKNRKWNNALKLKTPQGKGEVTTERDSKKGNHLNKYS